MTDTNDMRETPKTCDQLVEQLDAEKVLSTRELTLVQRAFEAGQKANEAKHSQQAQGEAETLTAICDLLGIGDKARDHTVIMTCISNIHHFSEMLHAVEHKFFMVPGETDEDYTSEERGEECLVNSWGSTKEQYLEQFERALEVIRPPAPAAVPEGWALVPIEPTLGMLAALAWNSDEDIALGHAAFNQEIIENYGVMIAAAPTPAEPDHIVGVNKKVEQKSEENHG